MTALKIGPKSLSRAGRKMSSSKSVNETPRYQNSKLRTEMKHEEIFKTRMMGTQIVKFAMNINIKSILERNYILQSKIVLRWSLHFLLNQSLFLTT